MKRAITITVTFCNMWKLRTIDPSGLNVMTACEVSTMLRYEYAAVILYTYKYYRECNIVYPEFNLIYIVLSASTPRHCTVRFPAHSLASNAQRSSSPIRTHNFIWQPISRAAVLRLLDPKDDDTKILRNVGDYLLKKHNLTSPKALVFGL